MRALSLVLSLCATQSVADVCDDLWFTRNQVFDVAGYCFGSALGRHIFDNSDCTTSSPELSLADQRTIEMVQEVEAHWDCDVDTTAPRPLAMNLPFRRTLVHQPVITGFESACIGWQVAPMPLYSGRDTTTAVIGQIVEGDDLSFGHIPVDGWEYVTIGLSGEGGEEGWAFFGPYAPERCEGWAG